MNSYRVSKSNQSKIDEFIIVSNPVVYPYKITTLTCYSHILREREELEVRRTLEFSRLIIEGTRS